MITTSRGVLRANLNTYTSDDTNTIWTEAQKNLAINMAIRSSWPEIHDENYFQFTLTAGSYIYIVDAGANATIPVIASVTRAPLGPAQIRVSTDPFTTYSDQLHFRDLRHSVVCDAIAGWWCFEFEKTFVDGHDGYLIETRYEQIYPELSTDVDTTEVPEDYITPRALFELCGMEVLKGHHTDVQTFRQERANFYEQAERAKARYTRLPLPRSIGLKWD